MRKYLLYVIMILMVIMSDYSCTLIFDADIRDETVVLLSPPNGYITTVATQQFWWETIAFADKYQVQLVSPSFDNIERLFVDTLTTSNNFNYSLIPGEYQWRVRAINESYETEYSTFSLRIDSTADISQEIIQLLQPVNYDTTNVTDQFFKWVLLYNAEDYNFQMYYSGGLIISFNTVNDTVYENLEEGDGLYEWKIRGQNEFSNTAYSSRFIYLDTQSPEKPQLLSPANNAHLNDTIVRFVWERKNESGSGIWDSLYVSTDSLHTNDKIRAYLSKTWFEDSLGTGVYYWRVRSIDAAGNKSEYSNTWKLTIQESYEK